MNHIRGAILILSVLVTGCSVITQVAADAVGVPIESKRVVDKWEPRTLVAEDGSTCVVTAGRFRKVKIGDDALCGWSDGRSAGSPTMSALTAPPAAISGIVAYRAATPTGRS